MHYGYRKNEKIYNLAASWGYDGVLYSGEWNGCEVYEPIFWDDE